MYDYRCVRCGGFRDLRPMSESRVPRACPACGAVSERILSAPFLAGQDGSGSVARAAGQGRVPWRTFCGIGCSHVH